MLHLLCADAESKEAIKLLENIIKHKHIFIEPFNVKLETPLHVACKNNNLLAAKLLLATNKINVQLADNNGFTLLHFACKNSCNKEIITELLQKGCDANAECKVKYAVKFKGCNKKEYKYLFSPLQLACMYGNKDAVESLLKLDEVDINITGDSYEDSPLAIAVNVNYDKEEIIEILIQQENINKGSINGAIKVLFDFIKKYEDERELTIMHSFIHHKWEIIKNEHKEKILDFCMKNKKNNLIKLIINKINQKNKDYIDSVLFTDEDNLNNQNNFNVDKKELLLRACENNNIGLVKILLEEEKVDVNYQDRYQQTPFIIACIKNYLELANLLIEKNANINNANNNCLSALNSVINNQNLDLAKIIFNHPHFSNEFAEGSYYLDSILKQFTNIRQTKKNIEFYKNITKILLLKDALYSEDFNNNNSVAKLLEEVKTEILQESKVNFE